MRSILARKFPCQYIHLNVQTYDFLVIDINKLTVNPIYRKKSGDETIFHRPILIHVYYMVSQYKLRKKKLRNISSRQQNLISLKFDLFISFKGLGISFQRIWITLSIKKRSNQDVQAFYFEAGI